MTQDSQIRRVPNAGEVIRADALARIDGQLALFDLLPISKGGTLTERFIAFHNANPHIFRALHQLASATRRDGWRHGSIALYYERLRWSWAVRTNGGDYKLANAHRAFYARALMAYDPQLVGFFRLSAQDEPYTPDLSALGLVQLPGPDAQDAPC